MVWFSYTGNAIAQRLIVTSSTNEQTIKTNPIIAQNSNSSIYSRLIVAWSSPVSTLGAVDEGIFYRVAKLNSQGSWEWTTVDTKIAGTNKYSINPTISYKEIVTPLDFHIAWEESNNIKYTYLRALSDGSATLGAIETPSSGSEFQYNYRPSITVSGNNSVKLAWLSATEPGMDGAISFRSKTGTTWGAFWNFLDTFEPDFVSINKIGASGEFAFVYGLAEYFNYICKNASQTNNLGTHEKYMQLANTPGVSITAVSHLKQGTPITLNVKNISLSTLQKNSGEEDLNTYRGISIFKDTSIISCRIGGIKFGNEDIDFERIDYQDSLKDITKASNYLVTKPFAVSGSSLSFQMKTGFNGSQADLIKENGFIKFKAELIEQSTGAVYALKEIFLNGASSIDEGEMTYNIDLTALKDKTVRLRLTPENNGAAGFAVSNILTPERNPVAKENAVQLSLGESSIPTIYALSQNYPNPFNPSTVISYDIPEASRVTLKVYDILGREVADLVNEFKEAGRYNVKFDASHLSTGIYIYQLRANDYVSVKKMSFVK